MSVAGRDEEGGRFSQNESQLGKCWEFWNECKFDETPAVADNTYGIERDVSHKSVHLHAKLVKVEEHKKKFFTSKE